MSNIICEHDFKKAEKLRLVRKGALMGYPIAGPMEVGIIPTYACNYKCVFCALEHEPGGLKKTLPFDKAKALIDDLAKIDTGQVSVTGGGDPLCYKQIDDLVALIIKRSMDCSVCTNGALINDNQIDVWAKMGVHLSVSFNAADHVQYQKIHPGSTKRGFDQIVSGLEKYVSILKNQSANRGMLSMNFVICKLNVDQIVPMARLAKSIGADQVQFRTLQPRSVHQALAIGKNSTRKVKDDVQELFQLYGNDPSFTVQAPWGMINSEVNQTSFPCLEGYIASYIDSDGTVFPCCLMSDDIENHYIGNVAKTPFSQLWTGQNYQAFRKESWFRKMDISKGQKTSCVHCPKAKHFQYLIDEKAPGNFIPLYEKAITNVNKGPGKQKTLAFGALQKSGCEASFEIESVPDNGRIGDLVFAKVRVSNRGDSTWPSWKNSPRTPVGLGYHLLDKKGRCILFDINPRAYLEHDLMPNQSALLTVQLELPKKNGDYLIEFDLVQERVAWFSSMTGQTCTHAIRVDK